MSLSNFITQNTATEVELAEGQFDAMLNVSREGYVTLPVKAGKKVMYDPPAAAFLANADKVPVGAKGEVVVCRIAGQGHVTGFGSGVFVLWDGETSPRLASSGSLRYVEGSSEHTRRVASLAGLLHDFTRGARVQDNELVHKSTKDLWSLRAGEDGGWVIERLFDDKGPLEA